MDPSRLAITIAELAMTRTRFDVVIGSQVYRIYPRLVYIPAVLFDPLSSGQRGEGLPEAERVVRRSTDSTFRLVGYIPSVKGLPGSTSQVILFSADDVSALIYDSRL